MRKLNKKGFLASIMPNVIIIIIMLFIVAIFYLVFSLIDETTNEIISFENEPRYLTESILYSVLEGGLELKKNYYNLNEKGPYFYQGKELIKLYFNEDTIDDDDLEDYLEEIMGKQGSNYEVKFSIYKDGKEEIMFVTKGFDNIYGNNLNNYNEIDGGTGNFVQSKSTLYFPIKDGVVQILVHVREFYE